MYVDDILIFGTSIDEINDVKEYLSKNFDMKDLGQADVILNINWKRVRMGLLYYNLIMWRRSRVVLAIWTANPLQHHMIPVYYFKRTEDKERKIFLISAH